MHLYRTTAGAVLAHEDRWYAIGRDWDSLVNDAGLPGFLAAQTSSASPDDSLAKLADAPLAPIVQQEVWAAGVTYFRSRTARMEEAEEAGGGGFYDRVYEAERPELFLKATPHRVVGPGQAMRLRSDSQWIVPEPELVLVITSSAHIIGYTVGNDLSCRDIEGENPLYLPQAKTFDRCAAVGPAIHVPSAPLDPASEIRLTIRRGGDVVFDEATTLQQMKRTPEELVEFLFRDNSHPHGCMLMTGTGIVPPDDFSLQPGDAVDISISEIGVLSNTME